MNNVRVWLVASFLALSMSGCGDVGNDGDLVGGSCESNSDCEDFCLRDKDFPEGLCTVQCRDTDDCPGGTVCIDKEGGICALYCDYNDDCRRGYDCKRKDLRGEPGEEFVCIGD